jgi:cytochrome c-type protein NapC
MADSDKDQPGLIGSLFRPSVRWSIFALVATGIAIGVVGVVTFDYSLEASSTESFCISCHEMEDNAYATVKQTSHFHNSIGVRPTRSDCHLPKPFIPKMIRKIEAAREVWGHLTGIIDTPEKYAAHAPVMKAREVARLQANDSAECRNCHDVLQTDFNLQSAKARRYHQAMEHKQKTCIDCHKGIAHGPAQEVSGTNGEQGAS